MPNFLALKTQLADWLAADATRFTVTVRGDLINQSQRDILRHHDTRFGEFSDSASATTPGTRTYALPTNFSRPHLFRYKDAAGEWVFPDLKDFEWLIREYPDPSTTDVSLRGSPIYYAVWGANYILAPTPDAAVVIERDYYRYLPDLSGDTDSNDFTNLAPDLLLFGALLKASKYLVEDARVEVWREEYSRVLSQVTGEHRLSQTAARRPVSRMFG